MTKVDDEESKRKTNPRFKQLQDKVYAFLNFMKF